jgi:hypothetical protein
VKNKSRPIVLILFLLSSASVLYADSWALPTENTICSANKKYCLKITPKKLTSQLDYFSDKVDGRSDAGGDKKQEKNFCKGEFSARNDKGKMKTLWTIPLVNEVSPVDALISDDGDYVVTFDNWHSVGYGDDAVVIYRAADGNLVKKLALTDFLTESDFNELSRSVSSIWWQGGKHTIENGKLVLKVAGPGNDGHGNEGAYFPINIDLTSGAPLDEKKDRYPKLYFVLESGKAADAASKDIQPPALDGCPGVSFENVERVSNAELLRRIVGEIQPTYPPAARAVRAIGSVNAYVQVSENGEVLCAKAFSGHPLLRASVAKALMGWQFQKNAAKYWGTITFTGKFALIAPDGTVLPDPEK